MRKKQYRPSCSEHCDRCFYCGMPLSPRHEHDHFPVPACTGGTAIVPVCINCHDLKDRIPLDEWPVSDFFGAWTHMPPSARIWLAKIFRVIMESGAIGSIEESLAKRVREQEAYDRAVKERMEELRSDIVFNATVVATSRGRIWNAACPF